MPLSWLTRSLISADDRVLDSAGRGGEPAGSISVRIDRFIEVENPDPAIGQGRLGDYYAQVTFGIRGRRAVEGTDSRCGGSASQQPRSDLATACRRPTSPTTPRELGFGLCARLQQRRLNEG